MFALVKLELCEETRLLRVWVFFFFFKRRAFTRRKMLMGVHVILGLV